MQPVLIILLVSTFAVAALAFGLGYSGRRRYARRYRVVALLAAALLAPALGLVLRAQTRAGTGLALWDIPLHPGTAHARGLPGIGEHGGVSSFVVSAPPDSIRAYYLDALPRYDWTLSLIHPGGLLFERAGQELMVRLDGRGPTTIVDFAVGPPAGAARP